MAEQSYIVALDQGTTSSRAVLYDSAGNESKISSIPLAASFPRDAWVEQDPEEIWTTQLKALQEVSSGISPKQIRSIGITNQRETVVVWDRRSGQPLAPAIVWQCRRSADICQRLRAQGLQDQIKKKTGLLVDAYFSGTKILWLLENIPGLQEKTKRGEAIFGTVDTWLLYKLSQSCGEPVFATEPSNACRTMLFGIERGDWDTELLEMCSLSRDNVAEIKASGAVFGNTAVLGEKIPISGILGDQQASLFGHGCVEKDSVKCTFGTGAFLLLNTGAEKRQSDSGLLSSVAWGIGEKPKQLSYVLEGSIFVAGALVQWMRDNLGLISSSAQSEELAGRVSDSAGVVIVPAFVGLGAPYWDEKVRGAIFGLTREAKAEHLLRASLEAVAHQVADLIEAPEFSQVSVLKIDGGMSQNKLFSQILSNLTGLRIEVPQSIELTALGAARMALGGVSGEDNLSLLVKEFGASHIQAKTKYLPEATTDTISASRCAWKDAISCLRS